MDCPHVVTQESFHTLVTFLKANSAFNKNCKNCRTPVDSKWMCITCAKIHCGRYIKGHALAHFHASQHPISIDLDNFLFYCYECDDYIFSTKKSEQSLLEDLQSLIKTRITSNLSSQKSQDSTASSSLPLKKKRSGSPGRKFDHLTGLSNLDESSAPNSPLLSSTPQKVGGMRTRKAIADKRDVSIWDEFCNLLKEMWTASSPAISPDTFLNTIWKVVPMFRGYQQQDAQEFIRYLLDRMSTELEYQKRNRHINVIRTFQGTLMNQIQCLECKNIFIKKDPFLDLSVSIPDRFTSIKSKSLQRENPCKLEDCLNTFIEVESLEESESYYCEKCCLRVKATKKLTIEKLPNVLCLHLKRFKFNRHTRSKVDTFVEFPITDFDLGPFTQSSKKEIYDLYSIIVHHGSSGSGHFLAYIWSPDNNSWFEMNDSHTRPATPQVVFQQNAYMLFYLKRNQNLTCDDLESSCQSLTCQSQPQQSQKQSNSKNKRLKRRISSSSSDSE